MFRDEGDRVGVWQGDPSDFLYIGFIFGSGGQRRLDHLAPSLRLETVNFLLPFFHVFVFSPPLPTLVLITLIAHAFIS